MAKRSTKAAVSYGTVNPILYGVDGEITPVEPLVTDKLVNFIFGSTEDSKNENLQVKLSKSIVSNEGSLTFVYDGSTKSGVVMKAGKLVSSKILNIESTNNTGDNNGKLITVTYLDTDKSTKTLTFDSISATEVEAKIAALNVNTINSSISDISTRLNDTSVRLNDASTRLSDVSTKLKDVSQNVIDVSKNVIDTSKNVLDVSSWVKAIETATYASGISKATNSPIVVTPADGTATGSKTYTIGIDVDNVTVKVNTDNKLTAVGNSYKFIEGTTTAGYLKSYVLQQTDAEGNVTTIGGTIDIPKDQVLKGVHLCKVDEFEVVDGKNTAKNEVIEGAEGFDEATGELYLHFSWHVTGDETVTSETYIKVTDMAPVYTGDSSYISINDYQITFDSSSFVEHKIGHAYVPAQGETAAIEATGIYKIIADNEKVVTLMFSKMDTSINTINTSVNSLETKVQSLDDLINGEGEAIGIIATINSSIKTLDISVNALETKVKTLEDFNYSSKANASQAKGNGFIDASVTIAEDASGKLVNTGSSIEVNLTTGDATYTEKTVDVAAKLEAPTTAGLMTTASIEPIKKYIDAVAQANQEGLTVLVQNGTNTAAANTAIAEIDSTDDHKLTLKTTNLGDVNITKNESTGAWEVNENNFAISGLALAADVAQEMITNERVVAAALNELNTRFKWIEI